MRFRQDIVDLAYHAFRKLFKRRFYAMLYGSAPDEQDFYELFECLNMGEEL